jgi:ribonuclease P protein component
MSGARPNSYRRGARLKRRRLIRALFGPKDSDQGRLTSGTVHLRYRLVPRLQTGSGEPVQIGFAPGRRKSAVIRNRLRRLMRETYRTHQHPLSSLLAEGDETLTVMALYRGTDQEASAALPRDMPVALDRLIARLKSAATDSEANSANNPPNRDAPPEDKDTGAYLD